MRSRAAVSLIELLAVISMLAALTTLLVPLFSSVIHDANVVATQHSLTQIRDAFSDYWLDTKHVELDGTSTVAAESNRFDIRWLIVNPVTDDSTIEFDANSRIGWRGPYLANSAGFSAIAPYARDGWNNDFVTQDVDPAMAIRDVRIVSGGPDGVVSIPSSIPTSSLTTTDIGDDIYVAMQLR